MPAAWVCIVLIVLTGDQVPVVKADEALLAPEPPATLLPPEVGTSPYFDSPFGFQPYRPHEDWYGEVGSILFDRSRSSATFGYRLGAVAPLVGPGFVDINPEDNRLISTSDLDFSPRPGLRFLVGRTIWTDPCDDRGCVAKNDDAPETFRVLSAELSYLGLVHQKASAAYFAGADGAMASRFAPRGAGNAYLPSLWPFDNANYASLVYRSRFDSAELNLRYSTAAGTRLPIDLLAGVRFVKLQENLDFLAANATNPYALTNPTTVGLYSTQTDNDLIGLQIGGDLNYRLTSKLSVVGKGRGGLLVNSASQRSNVSGTLLASNGFFHDTGSGNGVGLASLFEFGVHTNFHVSKNLSLMVGYQGLFLSDLSTATRQQGWGTDLGSRNGIDRNGNLFFFGPAAGLEWRW